MIICQIKERVTTTELKCGDQFVVTYSLKKGIQKFGEPAKQAVLNEMQQLMNQQCFAPIKKETLNKIERTRALESLLFLTQKKDETIKARHCANGSTQRDYIS